MLYVSTSVAGCGNVVHIPEQAENNFINNPRKDIGRLYHRIFLYDG